ncbi:MAG: alpha/beta hydrolase [Bacteroidia bacterium]|nr:alpha/beta hydrolase [Bacteroidia bacterium]
MKLSNIQSLIGKGGSIMLIILAFLLTCLLIIAAVIFIMSPGKTELFQDKSGNPLPGSISEKIFININGVEQGMFIRSKDSANPVLLYLHGGMPVYFLTKKYPTGLEDIFTVVWWEQRGFGLSYNPKILKGSVTLEQMISDTKEVTNYLRNRFGQQKIYLMGHSGGTFIGIQIAAEAPELYHAYIGVAQMSDQLESERLAYEYMVEQYRLKRNNKMLRKLESAPVTLKDGIPDSYLLLRDEAMHKIGIGTTHDMKSIVTGIFLESLTFSEYSLIEKVNLWRGKASSGVHPLWNTILTTDLNKQVPELKIPVYFFHGIYDYTVSYELAKNYFEKLKVPKKGFYTFEKSAHSPIFEEPEKSLQIIKNDIITGDIKSASAWKDN